MLLRVSLHRNFGSRRKHAKDGYSLEDDMVADFRGVVVQGNVAHERLAQINVSGIEQSCHELPKMGQSIGA